MIRGDEVYEERIQKMEGTTDDTWWWHVGDSGAWKGPIDDWNQGHFKTYVETIKNKNIVVTAGANMGLHTRSYASQFKTVYCFEPDFTNFHALGS